MLDELVEIGILRRGIFLRGHISQDYRQDEFYTDLNRLLFGFYRENGKDFFIKPDTNKEKRVITSQKKSLVFVPHSLKTSSHERKIIPFDPNQSSYTHQAFYCDAPYRINEKMDLNEDITRYFSEDEQRLHSNISVHSEKLRFLPDGSVSKTFLVYFNPHAPKSKDPEVVAYFRQLSQNMRDTFLEYVRSRTQAIEYQPRPESSQASQPTV